MRLSLVHVSALLASWAGAGCAVDTPDAHADESADTQQSAALVHLERQDGSSHVVARYVRASSVSADALRATGGSFELPSVGQCTALDGHPGVGTLLPVELLAAGNTSVTQAGNTLELVARSVPDVSDLVSGYVYSKTATLAPGPATLVLAGLSEPITIDVPAALPDVEIDGAKAGASFELDTAARVVRLGWSVDAPATGRLVVVDVHGGPTAMRCTFDDAGYGELESSWLGAHGTLVVRHLVHLEMEREPFQRLVVDSETSRTLPYTSRGAVR